MNHEQGGGTPDMENVRIGLHNLKSILNIFAIFSRNALAPDGINLPISLRRRICPVLITRVILYGANGLMPVNGMPN